MPGPPPEHPPLRLLKGDPWRRPMRSAPEPARVEKCPPPRRQFPGHALRIDGIGGLLRAVLQSVAVALRAAE